MTVLKYEKEIVALLVIDPYNDFISGGGKFWGHLKAVAEANNCVPNMLRVLNAAFAAKLRVFYPLVDIVPATTNNIPNYTGTIATREIVDSIASLGPGNQRGIKSVTRRFI